LCLSPGLEREFTIVKFALPGKEQLSTVLDGVIESAGLGTIPDEARDRVLDAAAGLTTMEAENAFALSVAQSRSIEPAAISAEKAQAVKKSGLLEIVEAKESLDSIGGLDVLKAWLLKRKNAFSKRAVEYGLPAPKGLLILGIPGTGKSLTAKATAAVFGVPLLKLDAGRIFGPSFRQRRLLRLAASGLMKSRKASRAAAVQVRLTAAQLPECSERSSLGCRRKPRLCSSSPPLTTCRSFHLKCFAKAGSMNCSS
jgi:hypothetical protein